MCGALRPADSGKKAVLMGWVNRRRDLGNLIFIDIRDRSGVTQVVFNKERDPAVHKKAEALRNEYVVAVIGTAKQRVPDTVNKNIATGEVELIAEELRILEALLFAAEGPLDKILHHAGKQPLARRCGLCGGGTSSCIAGKRSRPSS